MVLHFYTSSVGSSFVVVVVLIKATMKVVGQSNQETTLVTLEDGKQIPLIQEEDTLQNYGVCRVEIPFTEEERIYWSKVGSILLFFEKFQIFYAFFKKK